MSDIDDGGFAFPQARGGGMMVREYAAIKFAAAWTTALSLRHDQGGYADEAAAIEAVRLGMIQADAMIASINQPPTTPAGEGAK